VIEAVVFDLDGVLLDSEQVWDEAREQLAKERGGRWHDQAQKEMMGMSSTEWSRYMHERIGLPEPLELLGVKQLFAATVSSEEVAHGKPAPDVYLEAARRLGVDPTHAAAVEDSHNGILAAKAADMRVLAIPNSHFPPDPEALEQADVVLDSLAELTAEAVEPR
jgi:beta-phosphoglucomutase-like phosphatase (HAD superfamily)